MCLVGPPGVGKTSLGQSIAKRQDESLLEWPSGSRDEAEIRGHRKTYMVLSWENSNKYLKNESQNPLFLLDEVDKIGTDFGGDPASALLEVLDPEQNNSFVDHYIELNMTCLT